MINQDKTLKTLQNYSDALNVKNIPIGYPGNQSFNLDKFFSWWGKDLSSYILNNAGNPEDIGNYAFHTKAFEQDALRSMLDYCFLDQKSYWSFIASSGTKANIQGFFIARNYLSSFGKPIFYLSKEAHYSLFTAANLLDVDYRVIPCLPNGEIDYNIFEKELEVDRPTCINVTLGTTFKGAIDNVEKLKDICKRKKIKKIYFHADAAFFGGYLHFFYPNLYNNFDSISISGHKFFGSPIPFAVFFCKKNIKDEVAKLSIDYTNSDNMIIDCSRSALSPLILWWHLSVKSKDIWLNEAKQMLDNASFLVNELNRRGIAAFCNEFSSIVYFRTPSQKLCLKWSLAVNKYSLEGSLAHVICMQHVSKKVLQDFLNDLDNE